MKNLRTALLCACISLYSLVVSAQPAVIPINEPDQHKPKLFSTLPENIAIDPENLAGILQSDRGSQVTLQLGEAMLFKGQVVSVARQDQNLTSIVIRSTNFPGARFTFSRIVNEGKTVYAGRIMSMEHGDVYELQQKEGIYTLVKKNFYDLINE